MSTEEDREARSMAERTADERFPEMVLAPENEQRAEDFAEGYVAGYEASVHHTPAPAPDMQALIADARNRAESLRRMFPNDGETWDDARLVERLADAIEALVKERDQAIRDLDAGFAESDNLSAKYYQRMRAAEREMHARELHHFEEEQKSAGLAAVVEKVRGVIGAEIGWESPAILIDRIQWALSTAPTDALAEHDAKTNSDLLAEVERLRLVHAGQARLAMSAVFLADTDDDEGVQAFRAEWVKEHDARLIEGLADTYASGLLTGVFAGRDDYTRAWLRERARQVREGEA